MEELGNRKRQRGQCKHEIDMASFRMQKLVTVWGPAQKSRYCTKKRKCLKINNAIQINELEKNRKIIYQYWAMLQVFQNGLVRFVMRPTGPVQP